MLEWTLHAGLELEEWDFSLFLSMVMDLGKSVARTRCLNYLKTERSSSLCESGSNCGVSALHTWIGKNWYDSKKKTARWHYVLLYYRLLSIYCDINITTYLKDFIAAHNLFMIQIKSIILLKILLVMLQITKRQKRLFR